MGLRRRIEDYGPGTASSSASSAPASHLAYPSPSPASLATASSYAATATTATASNTPQSPHSVPLSVATMADPLLAWDLASVFYFWTLAGAGLEANFLKKGISKLKPAIFRLPRVVRSAGKHVGLADDSASEAGRCIEYLLDTHALSRRLSNAGLNLFPAVVSLDGNHRSCDRDVSESELLPIVIRGRDLDYQFERMSIFTRILRGYPYTRPLLHVEAAKDIPGPLRGQIWAALLGVSVDAKQAYDAIDKEKPNEIDHQLAVDIPRCHQYDLYLSSPTGHNKFRRILKAWCINNPRLVYWQGLDSVCAPFIICNFNDEAVALNSLECFVNRSVSKLCCAW